MRISDWSSDVCSSDLLIRTGEAAGAHLLGIAADRGGIGVAEVGVALDELRPEVREHAHDVVGDQDLTVADRGRTDADGRDRYTRSEGRRVGKEWVSTG